MAEITQPATESRGLCQWSCPCVSLRVVSTSWVDHDKELPARPVNILHITTTPSRQWMPATLTDNVNVNSSAVLSLWLWWQRLQPRSKLPLPRPVSVPRMMLCVWESVCVCVCVCEAALAGPLRHWCTACLSRPFISAVCGQAVGPGPFTLTARQVHSLLADQAHYWIPGRHTCNQQWPLDYPQNPALPCLAILRRQWSKGMVLLVLIVITMVIFFLLVIVAYDFERWHTIKYYL